MQLGRSGEVRALAVPEIPEMQEARNFWRLRVEQAVVSVCSLSACAFVLPLNPWNREGRVLCSAESGRNAPVLAGGRRILVEGAGFPLLCSGITQQMQMATLPPQLLLPVLLPASQRGAAQMCEILQPP